MGAIFTSLHCDLPTIGQAQPKESPNNSVVVVCGPPHAASGVGFWGLCGPDSW